MNVPDLYKILGVDAAATPDEIKKAYRRLAKELHPDVSKDPEAEEKFKYVHEAYKILGDEAARKEYDEDVKRGGTRPDYHYNYSDLFGMFFSKAPGPAIPINGEHAFATIPFTAYDLLHQQSKKVEYARHVGCPDCKGSGMSEASVNRCSECGGVGTIAKDTITPFGRIANRVLCTVCAGSGRKSVIHCARCAGVGSVPDMTVTEVQLLRHMRPEQVLQVKTMGNYGRHGGKPGDLFVKLEHDAKDRCRIENGHDLVIKLAVPLDIALGGGQIAATLPDGEKGNVHLAPDAQNGDRIAIDGAGLYIDATRRGMCYFEVDIVMPRNLSASARQRIADIVRSEQEGR